MRMTLFLQDPAEECRTLREQLLQANPQLADLPLIVALNKIDLLQQCQRKQKQDRRKVASVVDRVRSQTGIGEVYSVSGE